NGAMVAAAAPSPVLADFVSIRRQFPRLPPRKILTSAAASPISACQCGCNFAKFANSESKETWPVATSLLHPCACAKPPRQRARELVRGLRWVFLCVLGVQRFCFTFLLLAGASVSS